MGLPAFQCLACPPEQKAGRKRAIFAKESKVFRHTIYIRMSDFTERDIKTDCFAMAVKDCH